MPLILLKLSASIFTEPEAGGGGLVEEEAPWISHQLIFQPPLAAEVTILNVCCPAGSVTCAETVCQPWKEPVLGTVTVVRRVPSAFFSWNCAPLKEVATRKFTV